MPIDEAEAKRQRKAAKKAAQEAAAEAEVEVDEEEAKRQRKAAKKAAKRAAAEAEAAEEEVDEVEAKRQRKAAKKAAKLAAEAAAAEPEEEDDEAAAKKARKAARKAAKEAAAAEEAVLAESTKKKRAAEAEEDEDEAPKAKKSKPAEEATQEGPKKLKIFVKGLPYSITEDAFRKDFEECGEIANLQFPMEEGRPKGFAFITFATQEGYDASLQYDNTNYGGRYIHVSAANDSGKGKSKGMDDKGKGKGKGMDGDWTCPNPECGDLVFARNSACRKCGTANPNGGKGCGETDNENQVFIRGLPFSVDEEQLRKDFAECGEIASSKFPLNDEGRPRGIAFIKYATPEGVAAALKFDNTDYGGRTINVCKAGEGKGKEGKGKGKDGKSKGKDGKSKGKKGKAPSAAFANKTGCIVEGAGEKKTFSDSDDE